MKTLSPSTLLKQLDYAELANLSVLGALPESAIVWLLEHGEILQLDSDEELFAQGEQVREFYITLSGEISTYRPLNGQLVLTRHCEPGVPIGFTAMIALHDRYGTAIARSDSLVLKVSCDTFYEMHEALPQAFGIFLLNLTRELARNVGVLGDRLALLSESLLSESGD